MSKLDQTKLIPRNAPALRKLAEKNPQPHLVAGNPISTRLESGDRQLLSGLGMRSAQSGATFFSVSRNGHAGHRNQLWSVSISRARCRQESGEN